MVIWKLWKFGHKICFHPSFYLFWFLTPLKTNFYDFIKCEEQIVDLQSYGISPDFSIFLSCIHQMSNMVLKLNPWIRRIPWSQSAFIRTKYFSENSTKLLRLLAVSVWSNKTLPVSPISLPRSRVLVCQGPLIFPDSDVMTGLVLKHVQGWMWTNSNLMWSANPSSIPRESSLTLIH